MKDLIIGCYTNYTWDQIKYWVNSIEKSGFTGDKAMIVYNSDFDTVQKLLDNNFTIFAFQRDDTTQQFTVPPNTPHIVVQRFYDLWRYISNLPTDCQYDRIITTDVKDVVFQTNPSLWLDKNLGDSKILVSSESLQYKNEAWGNENMRQSFPMVHDYMRDKTIWNCGVLAGNTNVIKDLFLNIYLTCLGLPSQLPGGGGPDQAALNILLSLEPYKSITKYAASEEGWACQAGTTADPTKIQNFRLNLLDLEPKWTGEFATTNSGKIFSILHQWDRIPLWVNSIQKKYQ